MAGSSSCRASPVSARPACARNSRCRRARWACTSCGRGGGRATAPPRSGRGCRSCGPSPTRCPKRRSPPRSMSVGPISPVSSPTTAASSPRPTTRPTPKPRDSGSSKQLPRCCTVSPTTHRSSSCSTTSTGPTRARCGCWSTPSTRLMRRGSCSSEPIATPSPERRRSRRRSPRSHARPISNGSRCPASPSRR